MNKPGNIEDLYRNAFDGYEADVSPEAWENIERALQADVPAGDGSSAGAAGKLSGGLIAGGSAVIVAIVAGLLYLGSGQDDPVSASEKNIQAVMEQSPEPAGEANTPLEAVTTGNTLPASEPPATEFLENTSQNHVTGTKSGASHEYFTASDEVKPLPRQEADIQYMAAVQAKPMAGQPAVVNRPHPEPDAKEKTRPAESALENALPATTTEYLAHRLDYPNVITPNGDGKNEIFVIESDYILTLQVQVFDMTGKMIHQWNSLHGFWDGRLENGELAPEGKYLINIFAIREDGVQVRETPLTLVLKR